MTTQAPEPNEPTQPKTQCGRFIVIHAKYLPVGVFQTAFNGLTVVTALRVLGCDWWLTAAAVLVATAFIILAWILRKHESPRAPMLLTEETQEAMRALRMERDAAEAKARKEAAEATEPVR